MENESATSTNNDDTSLTLSSLATGYLLETGRWGKFLAILGFCFVGLIILLGLLVAVVFSFIPMANEEHIPFLGPLIGIIYIVMGAIYFFPIYYLFQFSSHLKNALANNNNEKLDTAFQNLKSHYKYIGILTIVLISLYILLIAVGLVVALMTQLR